MERGGEMLGLSLRRLNDRLDREEGQALVEYALILGLVAVVGIAMLSAIGTSITSLLQAVTATLNSAL
jgi:Flp pilus assembly pilin Flp